MLVYRFSFVPILLSLSFLYKFSCVCVLHVPDHEVAGDSSRRGG
jgi:hypothetical protein